ncbi:EF-hand calcium-binding domain-containing protein 12-like [Spea bombifrons]|uniref:EF-hand calcium-binding domain-containing protein 12-like n=1 Tax=Spea bombifrons TaxID=233779 RepID=UPI00234B0E70|nr:EF-hand calcium-binding domain-containing protein 12-like [Spea bombifrons]
MAESICSKSKDIDLTRYHQRDLSRTYEFRMACAKSGPPKSRIRRIIAPPMEKVESPTSQPGGVIRLDPGSGQKPKTFTMPGIITPETGPSCSDWIAARKSFRHQLDSMGDVWEYLQGKPVLTESEARVKERLLRSKSLTPRGTSSDREAPEGVSGKKAKGPVTNLITADTAMDRKVIKSPRCRFTAPTLQAPSPDGLGVVDKYLHQRRLRLVDTYNQTDKAKKKTISINDFKAVRKEAGLPMSDTQVEDMIISLSDSTPNSVNYKELSRGRSAWRKEHTEEHFKNINAKPATTLPPISPRGQKPLCPDDVDHTARGSSPSYGEQSESSNSRFLKLPPIDLEEKRPLSFEDMEDVIKDYRDQKRRVKSNTQPQHWLDHSRTVRTWNDAVDAHSQPSTMGEEIGEKANKYRMKCLWQYHEILKLCEIYKVPLSEELLERALLYPGDRWVSASGQPLKIRQPGTDAFSKKDVLKKHILTSGELLGRGKPGDRLIRASGQPLKICQPGDVLKKQTVLLDRGNTGKTQRVIPARTPYPPKAYVKQVKARVRGDVKSTKETLDCWVTFQQFKGMICNLKRRYAYRFRTTEDNAFWPGHLLDKLRVYLPQSTQAE